MSLATKQQIIEWCTSERVNPTDVEAAKLPETVEWAVQTRPAPDRGIAIIQSRQFPDRVEVNAGLQISQAHTDAFRALDQARKNRFIYLLRRDAMLLGVLYQGLGEPFDKIGYSQRIYQTDLTKATFMHTYQQVQNALILARQFIQLTLGPASGGTPPAEGPGGPIDDFLGGLDLSDL